VYFPIVVKDRCRYRIGVWEVNFVAKTHKSERPLARTA
jgi:hypothetical protein